MVLEAQGHGVLWLAVATCQSSLETYIGLLSPTPYKL